MVDAHALRACEETRVGSSPTCGTSAKQISIMYIVYLLQSTSKPEKSYIGRKIEMRLQEHNEGNVKSTKPFMPWKIIYYEQFYCKLCADKREVFLKSGFGYRLRKLLLAHQDSLK